jgi:peptide/nickel transport system permease protein
MTPSGETYVDIVWKQYRKNRIAVAMLWVVAGLFGVAIFAPVLASNQPYCFTDGTGTWFPWFVALVNPDTAIDFAFNVALIVFIPWGIAASLIDREARRSGLPGRRRLALALLLFFAMFAVAVTLMALLKGGLALRWMSRILLVLLLGSLGAWLGMGTGRRLGIGRAAWLLSLLPWAIVVVPCVRFGLPDDKNFSRDFKKEHVQGKGTGTYTLIPYGPLEQDLDIIFKPPFHRKTAPPERYREGQVHVMGTDDSGRDVLSRIIYGTRISMTIGVVAVSIYVTIGIIIGAIAGYFGGKVDMLISRVVEIVMLFPSFFLILTIVALIGPSIYIIMVVIGLTSWPTIARLTRGEFLRQRAIDYVAAARALGASSGRVIFRHVLPNALSPAFVAIPFGIVGAIITEASLSVLGFGVRPPAPSWGSLLLVATSNYAMWWLTVFAGSSIFLTVTVFNMVGNGLRDAMDPRLKGTQ